MNHKKKFVIVVSSFNYGGIEVLINRLSKTLSSKYDIHVFILSHKYDIGLLDDLKSSAKVYLPKNFIRFKLSLINIVGVNSILPIKVEFRQLIAESVYIHATDSHSLIFLTSILQNEVVLPKFSVGNYHSEEYLWRSRWWFRNFEQKCIKKFPAKNFFSMNQISINKLVDCYGHEFLKSRKMPAGIELPKTGSSQLTYDRKNQLICLGRLVKFKSYIQYVILDMPYIMEVIPDFEFHIYGDGPERQCLTELSKGLPVFFHGSVELNEIDGIISSYKVFIGSGTSILTASGLAVPSIIGVESCSESMTYGFLHETKGFDYQELGLEYPKMTISTKVIEALCASEAAYNGLCLSAKNRAEEFCITKTATALEETGVLKSVTSFGRFGKVRYFCSVLLWALLNKVGIIDSKQNRHFIK